MKKEIQKVLVTGGAGYVGSVLVPELIRLGYEVTVLDLYLFGEDVLSEVRGNPKLKEIKGDLRHPATVKKALEGCDAVIHLACISNDPSFELNPELGKSINYDAFQPLVKAAKDAGVKRFIYASSSSVYGIKEEQNVTEELPLQPLTDYSKYKAMCEDILQEEQEEGFTTLILRPATVCGYSPRLRLDLSVNILTSHAFFNKKIKVFGGEQLRPNFHVRDAADLYINSLRWPAEVIDGKIYNAGYQNLKIREIAEMVREIVDPNVEIETTPTDDHRSYHICSDKIKNDLCFTATRTVEDAIRELTEAFRANKFTDPMNNIRYYNIKTMQSVELDSNPLPLQEELTKAETSPPISNSETKNVHV